MSEWLEPLEYYFQVEYWGPQKEGRVIPEPVHRVLRELGGAKFEVDVVHPVDYEDGRVAFVMVKGDETYLFRYEPPDTARVMFLDELKGGRYEETFIRTEDDGYWIKGLFDHPRLDDDGPLTINHNPWAAGPRPSPDTIRAFERTDLLPREVPRMV